MIRLLLPAADLSWAFDHDQALAPFEPGLMPSADEVRRQGRHLWSQREVLILSSVQNDEAEYIIRKRGAFVRVGWVGPHATLGDAVAAGMPVEAIRSALAEETHLGQFVAPGEALSPALLMDRGRERGLEPGQVRSLLDCYMRAGWLHRTINERMVRYQREPPPPLLVKVSASERARALIAINPDIRGTDLAAQVGIDESLANRLLRAARRSHTVAG